jgi:Ca-activated chloride channel family protein
MSPPPKTDIALYGHLNQNCIGHNGDPVYLQMEIITGTSPARDRRPMNISVVLDRSGSMADERKIDYAKQALFSLIDRLSPEDYLSIVIYDDQIETLLPTQHVTDRLRIRRLVQEVYPRGSTNLGGGMTEGFRQVEQNLRREYVNRVILLSDGLANQGITDPHELNRIANRYRNRSISLSTMGVGLDYNENLMLGLSESGGGNYYFIESPRQLASIFERELQGLVAIVAQNAHIELTPGKGVTMNNVIGCEWNRKGDKWIIPIGDLYANEHRELTVELNVPEGSGTKNIASAILLYDTDWARFKDFQKFSVSIHYTDDVAELDKGKDWNTQAKVDVAVSTKRVERAMEALDAGRHDAAESEISEAKAILLNSPALINSGEGAGIIRDQVIQLENYSDKLKDEKADQRQVKKSMQYHNYKTQKKKE